MTEHRFEVRGVVGSCMPHVHLQSIIRASRAIARRLGSADGILQPARSARSRDFMKATFELKPQISAFCSVRRRTTLREDSRA